MSSGSNELAARSTIERAIEARVHGRYLVRTAPGVGAPGLLVGFHGYAEDAEIHLNALSAIPDIERWVIVSVQALHPFYTKDQSVVANWMTRQGREHAIADNVKYIGRVLEAVRIEFGVRRPLVFVGFSQGGAMAYRAAANYPSDGLIILASDVPPDVLTTASGSLPPMLIGCGTNDKWYTESKHAADLAALRALHVAVESCVFDGGHEWGEAFYAAAARHLRDVLGRATPSGWPRISSSLFYDDFAAAIDWLCRAFGFEVRLKIEGDRGRIEHSELTFGDGLIMVGSTGGKSERPVPLPCKSPRSLGGANTQALCVFVEDVDAHCQRARAAGAKIVEPLTTHDYGEDYWSDRTYRAEDPEGHTWWFMQRMRGPAK